MEETNSTPEEIIEPVVPLGKSYAPSRTTVVIFAILIASTSYSAYKWYKAEEWLDWISQTKNFMIQDSQNGEMTTYHWKTNGLPAILLFDVNHDGNHEKWINYDFSGHKLYESFDDNEDGYAEYTLQYDTVGHLVQESYDMDEDGYFERSLIHAEEMTIESKDVDFDSKQDSIYVRRDDILINQIPQEALIDFYINYSTGDSLQR